jgi:hypothetical protein
MGVHYDWVIEKNAWPYWLHPVVRSEQAKDALLQRTGADGRGGPMYGLPHLVGMRAL